MHSNDVKNQFIAMRSRGLSLSKIADELHIPKSTLGDWDKQHEAEINRLRLIEWEEVEADFAASLQDDLKRVMKRVRAAEDELDRRQLKYFTMQELFQLIRENRREYSRKRALLSVPVERASKSSKPATDMLPVVGPNSTSEKPDISGRLTESSGSQPHIINDLQQPAASPSDSPAGRDGAPSPSDGAPKSEQGISKSERTEDDNFVGSVVINPTECAQGVIIKCLDAERAHALARSKPLPVAENS